MVSLIAATGLRIGELLALRWSVLDLEGGALAVRESVVEGKFQSPKTLKAVRTIPLGRHAVAAQVTPRTREPGRTSRSGLREPSRQTAARVKDLPSDVETGDGRRAGRRRQQRSQHLDRGGLPAAPFDPSSPNAWPASIRIVT
jgi:integrase